MNYSSFKGLSLDRLKTLRDVARAGGIKAAVGDDPVRQSLASRQMKELGECFGVSLTRREGQGLALTPHGSELANLVDVFLNEIERFGRRSQSQPINVSIGVGDSVFQWYLLPHMPQIKETAPKTLLIPHSLPTEEIVERVSDGRLEMGIVRSSASKGRKLVSKTLVKVKYSLFVPKPMMPADLSHKPKDVWKLPFASLTGGGEYARILGAILSQNENSASLHCTSLLQVFGAVLAGQYAAVLPTSAESWLPATAYVQIQRPELNAFERPLSLIWRQALIKTLPESTVLTKAIIMALQ